MEASALDALLSEDQAMIAQAVGEFARDSVLPRHEALDHAGKHPEDLWGEIAELGLFGVFVPEELGGLDAGFLVHAVCVGTLARAAGLAGVLACTQGVVVDAVLSSQDEDSIAKWLGGLATGELLGAPAMMEDDHGTACVATGDGLEVRVAGSKVSVPFPGRAGCYLVRARREGKDILVLVPADEAGVVHGDPEGTLGLSGFETSALHLEGALGRVLGEADLVDRVTTGARISVAAYFAGLGRGALDHAIRYSSERKQFKRELRSFGAIQERLVRSDARLEAARALVHGAARLRESGQPCAHAARQARLVAAAAAHVSTHDCVQVYGGYGYSREYPVERFYRDARWCGFGEFHSAEVLEESTANLD